MIYFDNAATSGQKPAEVINAMNFSLKNLSANPGRSGHTLSQIAANEVYKVRNKVSDFFGSDGPETVVFTANCTTSINFVLKGILKPGDHVIISDLEHNAVMRPIVSMNIDYTIASVSLTDDIDTIKNFKNAIKSNTKMIFCTGASNVLGKILPIEKIGKLCKEHKILFGVDAAQIAGILPINMKNMNIDYLCVAPHKGLYSPMGVGILVARAPINKCIIEGGTGTESVNFLQPKNLPEMLESGTVNLPAIISVGAGIEFLKTKLNCVFMHEKSLVNRLYEKLQNTNVTFYTNPKDFGYVPVISFNISDQPSEKIAQILSKKGFALRAGLHCAPTAHKKIGTLEQGTVRFSPSIYNNYNEVDFMVKELKKF